MQTTLNILIYLFSSCMSILKRKCEIEQKMPVVVKEPIHGPNPVD